MNVPVISTTPDPQVGRLPDLPRVGLAHLPTPIDALENLSRTLGGAALHVKRDDATGLAFGGNKVRQLEFYLGEALAQDADTVLITGAVQSNFVRLAAAAAAKLGLGCHIQLEERVADVDAVYRESGNVLLDRLLGAVLHAYPCGEDEAGADARLGEIAAALRDSGKMPYIIPLSPGHPPLGALGYVCAAAEILAQIEGTGTAIDEIVVASGSGHTHAGLLCGLRALDSSTPVTGVCVRRDARAQRPRLRDHCRRIATLLGLDLRIDDADIHLMDDFLAPGYGCANVPTMDAITMCARLEGLLLDPIYTGKAMAGFIQRARESDRSLLFVHTGGTPALFAYEPALRRAVS